MRLSKQQTAANRRKILEFATRLFQQHGFDRVGVAELMRAAGFTHGGFYNHFESKDALAAEACAHVFSRAHAALVERLTGADAEAWAVHVAECLVPDCVSAPSDGTTLAMLAGDASRQARDVQASFAQSVEETLTTLSAYLVRSRQAKANRGRRAAREQAIQRLSTFVGACVLARAVAQASPELSGEILRVNRRRVRERDAPRVAPRVARAPNSKRVRR